jgi:hypothetical protein
MWIKWSSRRTVTRVPLMLAAVVLAGCASSRDGKSDPPATGTPAASASPTTPPNPAKFAVPNMPADWQASMASSPTWLNTFVATLTFKPKSNQLKVPARIASVITADSCKRTLVRLNFTAVAGSRHTTFDEYADAANTGTLVGVIENPHPRCDSKFIAIPHGHRVALIITGDPSGGAPSSKLFDLDTQTAVPMPAVFLPCPGESTEQSDDQFLPKHISADLATQCDHAVPPNDAPDPSTDGVPEAAAHSTLIATGPWTLWIPCGADCCFADSDQSRFHGRKKSGSKPGKA